MLELGAMLILGLGDDRYEMRSELAVPRLEHTLTASTFALA